MTIDKTDFGYESIEYDEKKNRVSEVFSKVAPYYDRMNDILSMGMHRYWKKKFLESIHFNQDDIIADLACGTGDIILTLASKKEAKIFYAIDPNQNMLNIAKLRAAQMQIYHKTPEPVIDFICAFGENLSAIIDNSVSVLTMSFGFRNVTDRVQCLREIYRILKPGGRFYLLEFSKVEAPLDKPYEFYRHYILPAVGSCFFNDSSSYQYLADSIAVFWDQQTCLKALNEAGFIKTSAENFTKGIVCFYQGEKP